jgi:hypothetical protein
VGVKRISLVRGRTRAGYIRKQAAEKETWSKRRKKGVGGEDCII